MPSKTLVIGIGTTGTDVCRLVKEKILADYGDMDAVPWLRVLAFDTKDSEDEVLRGDKTHIGITSDAYAALKNNPNQAKARDMNLASWSDDQTLNVKASEGTSAGAKNIRMQGRVSWLYNSNEFEGAVSEALNALRALTADEALRMSEEVASRLTRKMDQDRKADVAQLQLTDTVTVFICGTLTGGTFSGAFLDAGYLVRTSPHRNDIDRVIGLVGIPSPKYTFQNRKANAYAALCELNYYHMAGTRYETKFPHRPSTTASTETPFSDIFLCQPDDGREGAEGPVNSAWAQLVYLCSISDVGQRMFAEMCNVGADVRAATDDDGWPMTFHSLGVTVIEYPAQWVIEGCTYRLCVDSINAWRAIRDEDRVKARQILEGKFRITSAAFRELLMETPAGSDALGKTISDVIEEACAASTKTTDPIGGAEAALDQGFDPKGAGRHPKVPGRYFIDTIATNGKALRANVKQQLLSFFREAMMDASRGPYWVLEYVHALHDLCTEHASKYAQDGSSTNLGSTAADDLEEARVMLGEAQEAPSLLLGYRGFAVKHWLDVYRESATDHYRAKLVDECRPWEAAIMADLKEVAEKLQERLEHPQYGITAWSERLSQEFQKRFEKKDVEAPKVHGKLLYQPQATIAADYAACLKDLKAGEEDAAFLSPTAQGTQYAQQRLIADWKWIGDELIAENSFFDEPEADNWKGKDRPLRAHDLGTLYDLAVGRFERLRNVRAVDRLRNYNVQEVLDEVSPRKKDIVFLRVNDDGNAAIRAANARGGLHKQTWVFYRGAQAAGAETAEGKLRTAIGPSVQDNKFLPLDDPTRILFIQSRSTFSLPMIEGLDPARNDDFLGTFQDHEKKRMEAVNDPTRGTSVFSLFSRIDIDFPVLISSPEDREEQKQAVAWLLAGIATNIVTVSNEEGGTPSLRYPLSASHSGATDTVLTLSMDLGQAARQIRAHRSALRQLGDALAVQVRQRLNAGMVAAFQALLDDIEPNRTLKFRLGTADLTRDKANVLLRNYASTVPNLLANWDQMYSRS